MQITKTQNNQVFRGKDDIAYSLVRKPLMTYTQKNGKVAKFCVNELHVVKGNKDLGKINANGSVLLSGSTAAYGFQRFDGRNYRGGNILQTLGEFFFGTSKATKARRADIAKANSEFPQEILDKRMQSLVVAAQRQNERNGVREPIEVPFAFY